MPIKKWTNIILITNTKNISVYKNGQLTFTSHTTGLPKYIKGDLHVNKNGGFDGSIASIRYFPKTLSQEAIDFIYKAGPNTKNYLGKFLDMFRSKKSKTKIPGVNDEHAAEYQKCKIQKRQKKARLLFTGQGCCQSNAITNIKTISGQSSEDCKESCKNNVNCVAATFLAQPNGAGTCILKKTKNKAKNLNNVTDFKTKINRGCNINSKCYSKRFNLGAQTITSNAKWEAAVDETVELLENNNKLTKADVDRNKKIAKLHTKALKKAFDNFDINKDTQIDFGEFTEGTPSKK